MCAEKNGETFIACDGLRLLKEMIAKGDWVAVGIANSICLANSTSSIFRVTSARVITSYKHTHTHHRGHLGSW